MLLSVVDEACGPLPGSEWADFAGELLVFEAAAKDATCAQVQVAASIGSNQMFVEQALRKRARSDEDLSQDPHRLEVDAHIRRPTEWVGRKVRRAPVPNAAQERQGAEEAERHRWAQEVLGILHEAALPSARMSSGLTGAVEEQRCCQGLRFRTLKKFVRIWRPFRRYLLSHDLGCFPTSVEPVLGYMALQARGLAARTCFKDFVNTLRFFEEAGERASEDLLHQLPALQNLTA